MVRNVGAFVKAVLTAVLLRDNSRDCSEVAGSGVLVLVCCSLLDAR